ncbi:UNVERIFIED_ORG: hypothetical protein J2X79_003790 [Arthrobacter globiformis]|nr:hypothetical protein [Arthrobacter globiformis]
MNIDPAEERLTHMESWLPESELDDWSGLAAGDLVSVLAPRMNAYQAWIDEKTPSSDIIWIRRADLGTRHLIERQDGVLIVRDQGGHVPH